MINLIKLIINNLKYYYVNTKRIIDFSSFNAKKRFEITNYFHFTFMLSCLLTVRITNYIL